MRRFIVVTALFALVGGCVGGSKEVSEKDKERLPPEFDVAVVETALDRMEREYLKVPTYDDLNRNKKPSPTRCWPKA
ncbi:MAG: hypothetical protein HC783_11410 [Rhodobacteraceae bacterium]|nr:hypothetical protein [Paracoccaceae bacterium]